MPTPSIRARIADVFAVEGMTDLDGWRQRLNHMFYVFIAVMLPTVIVTNFPIYLREGFYGLMVVDTLVWLWAIYCLIQERRGAPPHHAGVLLVGFSLSTLFFEAMGPTLTRPVWLAVVVVFGSTLYGMRGALLTTAANTVMLFVLYALASPADPAWTLYLEQPLKKWVMFVANSTVLCLLIGVSIAMLLDGLAKTLEGERKARAEVDSEHAEVTRAYDLLVLETTERQRLESFLQQAQKLEALGRFTGGIAHDLNNMLAPILAVPELLAMELPNTHPMHSRLELAQRSGERARLLLKQILLFSRQVPEPTGPIRLAPLLEDLLAQQTASGVEVRTALDAELHVLAEASALGQVFLNLIGNALKAMPDGGVLSVTIDTLPWSPPRESDSRECVRVTVSDTGVGMDADTLAQIFEPFFTTRPMGEGTGLGLATAHGIVAAYGGVITVDSTPGEGTRFVVRLPLVEAAPEPPVITPEPQAAPRGRVLLVDDNPDTRATVAMQLSFAGLEVTACGTAAEALAVTEACDLLITDLKMPDTDGLTLITQLKAQGWHRPILLTTGFADEETRQQAEALGVSRILEKPFSYKTLSAVLGEVLG